MSNVGPTLTTVSAKKDFPLATGDTIRVTSPTGEVEVYHLGAKVPSEDRGTVRFYASVSRFVRSTNKPHIGW